MRYGDPNKKLAIFVAERQEFEEDSPDDTWFHTFLMLVDETEEPVTVLQQLHYSTDVEKSDGRHILTPITLRGISDPEKHPKRFKELRVSPVVQGVAEEVMALWNDALSYAFYVQTLRYQFNEQNYKTDPEALNCRAGVIATLRSIGVEYAREHYAHDAGTECDEIIPVIRETPRLYSDWSATVYEVNEMRMNALGSHNHKERYVGPVPYPFISM